MKNLIKILLFLLPIGLFAQTPIGSLEVDSFYLSGILNGQYQIFKASEFIGVGGSGDNLGNHTATASLNLNGNEIDSVAIYNLFDTNADANYWALFEDASGNLIIQDNNAATDDWVLNLDGSIEIGNEPVTDNTEDHFLVWDAVTKHIEKREVSSLPSGGGGSGSTFYFFGGVDTSTTTIIQDTWTDVTWDIEDKKDASYTHTAGLAPVTLDSTGVYIISVHQQFNAGQIRNDGNVRIQADTGGGFADLPYSVGYASFGGEPFGAILVPTRGISISSVMYSATAGDIIKVQVYIDNAGDWSFATGSTITIMRIE